MTGPFLFPFNSHTVLLQDMKVFCDMIKMPRAVFRTIQASELEVVLDTLFFYF